MPIGSPVTTTYSIPRSYTNRTAEFIDYKTSADTYTQTLTNVVDKKLLKTVVSRSTRPWTNGKPSLWTPYKKEVTEYLLYASNNSVRWTPGTLWTAVNYRDRVREGHFGHCFYFETWRLPNPGIDRAVLDNKLLNKLKSDFNGGVFAAESKKAVGMITDRLVILAKVAKACKSLRFGDAAKALGFPPKRVLSKSQRLGVTSTNQSPRERAAMKGWLELQYGWMPLMKDIQSAMKEASRKEPRYFVEAVVSDRYKGTSLGPTFTASPVDGCLQKIKQSTEWYASGKLKFEWRPSNPALRTLSEFGLLNPAVVAWELIPFSFVVDWFLPIGDFLNTLDATFGVEFVGGLYIETIKVTNTHEAVVTPGDPSRDQVFSKGIISDRYSKKERTVLTSFPSPRLPSFKNPVSTMHCANALALLATSFRGR